MIELTIEEARIIHDALNIGYQNAHEEGFVMDEKEIEKAMDLLAIKTGESMMTK